MPGDALNYEYLVKEINCLVGGRIDKIFVTDDTVVFTIHTKVGNKNLLLSAHPSNARAHLSKENLLRKWGRISSDKPPVATSESDFSHPLSFNSSRILRKNPSIIKALPLIIPEETEDFVSFLKLFYPHQPR